MCGLVFRCNYDGSPVNNWILDTYDTQRNRGHEGFGLFNGKHIVHAALEDRILNWLCKKKNDSSLIMFHHRWPTSTINTRKAAHPFTTRKYFGDTEYILIHNGSIRNPNSRHEEHKKLGIKYQSSLGNGKFNDSESLLWDFALWQEGRIPEMQIVGDMAFICMKVVKGDIKNIFFYRNVKPLHMIKNNKSFSLASEGKNISTMVKWDTLHTFSYGNHHLTSEPLFVKQYEHNPDYVSKHHKSYSFSEVLEKEYPSHPYTDDFNYSKTPDHLRMSKKERKQLKKAITKRYAKSEQTSLLLPEGVENVSVDSNEPKIAQIEYGVYQYLDEAGGLFEDAYWRAEQDYNLLCESDELDEDIKYDKRLLERIMEFIETDPENTEPKSLSSFYLEITEGQGWGYA